MKARHYPSADGSRAICGRPDWFRDAWATRKAYESALNRAGMCKDCKRIIEGGKS